MDLNSFHMNHKFNMIIILFL